VLKSKSETLTFLKEELAFLERGGYGGTMPWKPVSIFLDSPSCPNRLDAQQAASCPTCWLYQFVPEQYRNEPQPCHFLALNRDGETVHSMSRQYTPGEVEDALKQWLVAEIRQLEASEPSEAGKTRRGEVTAVPGSHLA
jgi:hypothetical protein